MQISSSDVWTGEIMVDWTALSGEQSGKDEGGIWAAFGGYAGIPGHVRGLKALVDNPVAECCFPHIFRFRKLVFRAAKKCQFGRAGAGWGAAGVLFRWRCC